MNPAQVISVLELTSLGNWASAWDQLVADSELPTPFLLSWWLEAVGSTRNNFVLVVTGEELLGGMALESHSVLGIGFFRVLGGGKLCPDHLDLVSQRDRLDETRRALRGWFAAKGSRVVDLQGVRGNADLLDVFGSAFVTDLDLAPYEILPGSIDDYLQARSRRFGQRIRKLQRTADADGVVIRRVDPDEIPAAMAEFTAMHAARADRRELVRELPRLTRAVELGSAREAVWIFVAEASGICGAVLIALLIGDRLCLYQTARRHDDQFNNVGTLINYLSIRDATAMNMREVDFLRGTERYKSSFASAERRLLRVQAATGKRGRAALALLRFSINMRHRLGALRARFRDR